MQIWSAIVNTIFGSCFIWTIEMLVFILQLEKISLKILCKFKLSAALKSSKVFLNVPKTCFCFILVSFHFAAG